LKCAGRRSAVASPIRTKPRSVPIVTPWVSMNHAPVQRRGEHAERLPLVLGELPVHWSPLPFNARPRRSRQLYVDYVPSF
jgi:hypothetical protein